MKDTEIHIGLDKNLVRDFLAEQIALSWDSEIIEGNFTGLEGVDLSIALKEAELKKVQAELDKLRTRKAIIGIIEGYGWTEFDVSDEVSKASTGSKFRWNFIGTQEEYELLLQKINESNE